MNDKDAIAAAAAEAAKTHPPVIRSAVQDLGDLKRVEQARLDTDVLHSTSNEAIALLNTIAELDSLPIGLRIDALRELSNAAEDLAWKLALGTAG